VAYEEIDVHTVPGAAEEALKLSGGKRLVPVIVEKDKVVLGFCGGS